MPYEFLQGPCCLLPPSRWIFEMGFIHAPPAYIPTVWLLSVCLVDGLTICAV
jgi:hypothetical protein